MVVVENYGADFPLGAEPLAETKLVINDGDGKPVFYIWVPIEYFEPTRKDIQEANIWHEHWGMEARSPENLQKVYFFTECYNAAGDDCSCRFAIGDLETDHEAATGRCDVKMADDKLSELHLWVENRPDNKRTFVRSETYKWGDKEPNTEDKFIEVTSSYEPLRDGDNFYIWGTSAAEVDEGLDVSSESKAFIKLA